MVKTTQKSSSTEPAGRFPRNLVFTISDSSPSKLDKMMTWDDLDLFYGKVNLETEAFTWEKVKTMDFFKNDCSLRPEKW